jgi:hypothetical protein
LLDTQQGIELFKTQALKGLAAYMSNWPKIIATESITEVR